MNKFSAYLLFLFLIPLYSFSQILSVNPVFPTADDTVTIIYNATEGNGALTGISPVYAHAGLITNLSTSPTDWKHVQGNWGTPDPKVLMTSLGNNLHQIKYHIRSYYGVPVSEQVEKLAFVFRNADGSIVGRDSDGSDIYYNMSGGGPLEGLFLNPAAPAILEVNDMILVAAAFSNTADISLYVNNTQVSFINGNYVNYAFTASTTGKFWIKYTADDGLTQISDSTFIVVRGNPVVAALPPNIKDGVNYLSNTSVILSLFAPGKDFVYVLGDFNDYQPDPQHFMHVTPDMNRYWIQIDGLTPQTEYGYQYLVDGELRASDPYSEKLLDPWDDPWIPSATYPGLKPYPVGKTSHLVSVLQTGQTPYNWQHTNFQRPAQTDLVVYELLVRDFVATHDYQTLIDTLDYLQKLGVNAIELMPIMEFEGNSSWGYGVSHFFAPDKYYGTKDKLKEFIDECHGRGFAVILDVVTNHVFGESPLARMFWDAANGKPAASSPYLNPDARHPYTVGYDFNHESLATQEHFDRLFAHWVTEYKIDGYRLDLAKGITQKFSGNDVGLWGQYDASRIALVKGYGDRLWSVDPDVYMILEYFAENSEEKELAEYGFLIWGNLVFEYNEATMGWISGSNFQDVSAKQRNWNVQNLVGYMESHDEERQMYKNLTFGNSSGIYNVKTLPVATDRSGMAAAFLFTVPGPKMLYMFGELGYDISIDDPCRTCEKPILWNYLDDPDRRKLFNVYAALIKLKEEEPAFSTSNYSMDVGGTIKRIHLNHASMNVTVVGNFSVTPVNGPANFQHGGWWYDYFSGDSINVSNTSASLSFDAGEYHIYTDVRLSSPDIALGTINPLILGEGISAFPNPSNNSVTFAFDLLSAVPVRMELYDMNGRIIRRFMDEQTLPPGKQTYTWDGKNAAGQRVNPGYYFVRIQAGTDLKTLKLVYLD